MESELSRKPIATGSREWFCNTNDAPEAVPTRHLLRRYVKERVSSRRVAVGHEG